MVLRDAFKLQPSIVLDIKAAPGYSQPRISCKLLEDFANVVTLEGYVGVKASQKLIMR